ncbi:DNA-binding MarR family transcriptional regulator [Amycolatopsis bartoniae]|uniref:MarR family transcriptional regulator n=1 Tax=Amycolatopsis bartoniae TaxID=941986 RepID=A0A8H9IQJ8_9PSEU|nr:MarR family transcriptional regulator [Amycolatopsis bartoniae]MBB2939304.1 DNA-binding MarR family transcriptional regulator [Amycolatopsis bartoniae]TVT08757.1 MarR family transcriptional regulator [Amycolatopsis bartoniae]GHF37442.1 MarR family transcriptional regulator [Amycolatopsis bartoniae]
MSDVAERGLVRQWHDLQALHAAVSGALEARLQERHGIGVTEFEALEQLATADRKCRGTELTEVVHLSQSATSRLVARMEREGLVERSLCEDDRRGVFVNLTAAGRRRYDEAKPTHREVLAEVLARA